jgi:hypothetical protein
MVGSVLLETVEERGTFERISLALLLIRALDRRWSGTLVVDPPSGHQQVLELKHGLVCRVLVSDGYARLGEIAVEHGILVNPELEQLLEGDRLLGQVLTERQIFDEQTLLRALVLQILRRLERMFGYPTETHWAFGPDVSAFDGMPEGVRVDTLRVLWAGMSAHGEMGPWLERSIERIGDTPFQVKKSVDLRRFGFTGDARELVRVIREERVTTGELVLRGIAPEEICRRIVYLLAITRYLDFAAAAAASTAPPLDPASVVDDLPSISEETVAEDLPQSSEPEPSSGARPASVAPPRRVARIRLRRVAVKHSPAAPDPPGSGEIRVPSSSREGLPSSDEPPSSDSVRLDDPTACDRLRLELPSRLARLGEESPFSLLEVDPQQLKVCNDHEATDMLWDAYERRSRDWHPDHCPAQARDLREGMARVHAAMTDAFAELCDHNSRAALLAGIEQPPTQAPQTMRSTLDSASDGDSVPAGPSDLRRPTMPSAGTPTSSGGRPADSRDSAVELHAKALMALSEQRIEQAEELCRSACEVDADNPDFQASLLWIRSHQEHADLTLIADGLAAVSQRHPEHVTASYYRGVVARRAGEKEDARAAFDRVLEIDPEHVGARLQIAELMWASDDDGA